MAPAAVQAGYALSRFVACQRGELADTIGHGPVQTPTGTCHVWSENAELPSLIAAGGTVSVPTRETVIWAPLRPSPTDVPAIDQR